VGAAHSVNLGPPPISETIRARKLKSYIHLDRIKYSFQYDNFSTKMCVWGAAPSVNLGPPHILETGRLES